MTMIPESHLFINEELDPTAHLPSINKEDDKETRIKT
jgi:hypothetical protein